MLNLTPSSQTRPVVVLIAEDDDGHFELVHENLREAGVKNQLIRFRDGQEVLDFFFGSRSGPAQVEYGIPYVLLLDMRMPRVDGQQVLERLKSDEVLKRIPIIMLTTTDSPAEIEASYKHGCNGYITKPIDFDAFSEVLRRLGLFIMVMQVAELNEISSSKG